MRRVLASFALAGVLVGSAFAQTAKVDQAHANFAQSCGVTSERSALPDLSLKEANGAWQKTTASALRDCKDCSRWANAWRVANGTVVEVADDAESGDWTRYITYCFDVHGNATRARSEFRSAHGWAAVQEYTRKGSRFVLATTLFFDLNAGRETSEPPDWANYRELYGSVPPYKKLEQIPFAGFLGRES